MEGQIPVFVAHVKRGYEDRARHMERMLAAHGLSFEYMLDGDMTDFDEALQMRFFGDMREVTPVRSCAAKHLLLCEKMVRERIDYALILEDDIFLTKKFDRTFAQALHEMQERHGTAEAFYVGFEATAMGFVPRSQRKKGQVAYPGRFVQCTGAYLANQAFARAILAEAEQRKCAKPVDLWLNDLRCKDNEAGGLFHLYWSHPVVAVQGSHMGKFESSIGNSVKYPLKNLRRSLTFLYKKILYFFR